MSHPCPDDTPTCAFGSGTKPRGQGDDDAVEAIRRVSRLVESAESTCVAGTDPLLGTQTGKYKIESLIGRGGMGSVYRARQTHPVQRDVALKVMSATVHSCAEAVVREAHKRFIAEGQVLASLRHPEIACVFDADTTRRGEPYLVMELVDGMPLNEYCQHYQVSIADRIELVRRICHVVAHAHGCGIVHRDLKPDNILVSHREERPQIKIIDFGIAKILEGHDSIESGMTASDQFIGTPGYLSPEQARGSDVDARTDVYSIGAILFELLCGSTPINPFDTPFQDVMSLRQVVLSFEPPRPSARIASRDRAVAEAMATACRASVSRLIKQCRNDLDWVVLKALEPDRRRRYATARDFADDLRRILDDEPTHAAAPSLVYRARKMGQRHPIAVVLVSCLAVAGAGLFAELQHHKRERIARTIAAAHQCDSLLDQVKTLQIAIHETEIRPQSSLTRAAAMLGRSRELLRHEPTLVRYLQRTDTLERAIRCDGKAFDLVSALDGARLSATLSPKAPLIQGYGRDPAIRSVKSAFADFGLDVDKIEASKAATRFSGLPSVLVPHVIEALDFWIDEAFADKAAHEGMWPYQVLGILDPNPDRQRLRRAVVTGDAAALTDIAARGIDRHYQSFSRVQLAGALAVIGEHPHSIAALRRAQEHHPDNFWINHQLAVALSARGDTASDEESIRYFSIAVALRPDAAGPMINLATKLKSMGRIEEASDWIRRADRIQPTLQIETPDSEADAKPSSV